MAHRVSASKVEGSGGFHVNPSNANRIRFGVLAFPISGLVAALAALAPGIDINPATDPVGFARAANLVGLVNLAGLLSFVLLLYGFQALYAFLSGTSVDRWAFVGMVLSIAGVTLFSSFLGIFAFAGPVAGVHYLNGQGYAISIIAEAISPSSLPVLVFGGFSLFCYTIGSILFGAAIWRCGTLPRWSAILYAISTPLGATPHYISALWFLGGMLLFLAGVGIARGIWKFRVP